MFWWFYLFTSGPFNIWNGRAHYIWHIIHLELRLELVYFVTNCDSGRSSDVQNVISQARRWQRGTKCCHEIPPTIIPLQLLWRQCVLGSLHTSTMQKRSIVSLRTSWVCFHCPSPPSLLKAAYLTVCSTGNKTCVCACCKNAQITNIKVKTEIHLCFSPQAGLCYCIVYNSR